MIFDRTTKTIIAVATLVASTFLMVNHIVQDDPIDEWGLAGLLFAVSAAVWVMMWRETVEAETTALALSDEAVLPRAQEWIISKDVVGELPPEAGSASAPVIEADATPAVDEAPPAEDTSVDAPEPVAEVVEAAVEAAPADSETVEAVVAEAQAAPPAAAADETDDLKRIEGIGNVYAGVLNEAGVTTFAHMAAMTSDALADIIVDSGRPRPSSAETWPEQATLAAKGDWAALDALQDELVGGRRED